MKILLIYFKSIYAATVALIFEYMHSRNIVYRYKFAYKIFVKLKYYSINNYNMYLII